MSNDKIQESKTLTEINDAEKLLEASANLRKFVEQIKIIKNKLRQDELIAKYLSENMDKNKDDLTFRLDIIKDFLDIVNK